MTDKIKGYEDEHAVNYRLRFGSDAESFKKDTARYEGMPTGIAKAIIGLNGGDEPSGDASTRKDEVTGNSFVTSPIYTREELVDLAARLRIKADMIHMGERIKWGSETALMYEAADALIAIGQVRVK